MTDEKILSEIGKRLIFLRKQKGLTQVELANRIGMEKSNYNILEKGKSNPQILTYVKICSALECDLKDLFFFEADLKKFIEYPKKYIPRKHKK